MAVNREQVLQSAEKLLAKGKLDQALKEYLRVLEDNPKDISTLNKVGDLYVRMNRPGDSIPYFTRIADFYSKDGFFLKAIAIFKKINKIDPARLEVYDKLADLYHKQGLVQDARSQYQVLADHYQKNNRVADAIGVYKKMAAIDPSDIKIQVRLADLYRSAHQKDEAVMQYGLIGNMLLKRGAHDEAAQVFQKALELSPDDVGVAEEPRPLASRPEQHRCGHGRPEGRPPDGGQPRALCRGPARDGPARRGGPDGGAGAPARRRCRGAAGVPPQSPHPGGRVRPRGGGDRSGGGGGSREEAGGARGRASRPDSDGRSPPRRDARTARESARGRRQPCRAREGLRHPGRGCREAAGPGAPLRRTTDAPSRRVLRTSRPPRS